MFNLKIVAKLWNHQYVQRISIFWTCCKSNGISSSKLKKKNFQHYFFFSLKDLMVTFEWKEFSETENWYPCGSNLVSINLQFLPFVHPPQMMRLLMNTGLKYFIVFTKHLVFDEESFKKLVASQLDVIDFTCMTCINDISLPPTRIFDSRLDANKTVKELSLRVEIGCPNLSEVLFPKYFQGLIHLKIQTAADYILQSIFQFQVNSDKFHSFLR